MFLVRLIAVIGSVLGGITLSLYLARYSPLANPLERLYLAVFLSVLITIGVLFYSLLSVNYRQALLRSCSWWPLPIVLLVGGGL